MTLNVRGRILNFILETVESINGNSGVPIYKSRTGKGEVGIFIHPFFSFFA